MAHVELEHITAGPAAKAIEEALVGVDREGRSFLFVKGAEALELAAVGLEGDVLADEPIDVGCGAYLLDKIVPG
jgi:hypothetical protein